MTLAAIEEIYGDSAEFAEARRAAARATLVCYLQSARLSHLKV